MPSYADLILASGAWIWLLFVFALGACAGSLINVLVYRLPLGLSVVTPPSRCPACQTKLTWRENIPVFGWLILRGRCRFCKSRISPEYPLVEAFVGLLFAGIFVLWYVLPQHATWLGVDWAAIRPDWARVDAIFDHWPRQSWPMFIVLITLVGSLVAMSLVDLKTYTIPLQIPWFATVTALLFHVGYAVFFSVTKRELRFIVPVPFEWSMRTPRSWWWVGASVGGVAGLIVGMWFLHKGWIRRSFADYAQWEKNHLGEPVASVAIETVPADPVVEGFPWMRRFARFVAVFAVVLIAAGAAGSVFGPSMGLPHWCGLLAGVAIGPLIAAASIRSMVEPAQTSPAEPPAQSASAPSDLWIQYPHARREMFKELLFLAPAIGLALIGGWLFELWLAPRPAPPALWIMVLGGVLQGYIIAGAIVWAVRIFGSLGFGKEAMGLGDVHLLAAVGACIGWVDAALAFPLAAVVGLYWVIVSMIRTGGAPRAMPFGPYLAGATMLVLLCKPLLEIGLNYLMATPPGARPINLP